MLNQFSVHIVLINMAFDGHPTYKKEADIQCLPPDLKLGTQSMPQELKDNVSQRIIDILQTSENPDEDMEELRLQHDDVFPHLMQENIFEFLKAAALSDTEDAMKFLVDEIGGVQKLSNMFRDGKIEDVMDYMTFLLLYSVDQFNYELQQRFPAARARTIVRKMEQLYIDEGKGTNLIQKQFALYLARRR